MSNLIQIDANRVLRNGNVLVLGAYDVGIRPVAYARLLVAD